MMKTGTAPAGFPLALVCMVFLLVAGLAYPTAAGAQTRGEDDIPEQLWRLYPLDPTKTDAGRPETVQPQPPPPGPQTQTQTDSGFKTQSESPNPQAQSSGESDSGRSLTFPVLLLGALLGLLVSLLVVATARNGAFAMAGEHLARAWSPLVAPLRAATNAPRYVGRGGAAVVSPLRALPRLPRRIGHLLLRFLRAFGPRSSSRASIKDGPARSGSDTRHRVSIIGRFASTLAHHRVSIIGRFASTLAHHRVSIIVVAIGISALAVLEWVLFL
jgi:hypothetical protein